MNRQNQKEMIMELDRQFDRETAKGGLKAWVSYFARDGVMVMSQGEDIVGPDAIQTYMSRAFSLPGFSLRWEPVDTKISCDETLAYTYGSYVRKYKDENGSEIVATGKYTTIWQLQEDKSWKIVLDIGN